MDVLETAGVEIAGICSRLPSRAEDNLAACTALYGDAAKARGVVSATGIRARRVAEEGVSSLDLCVAAAEDLFAGCAVARESVGAVLCVTFTPESAMPCNACRAQHLLSLPGETIAFDVGLACSGYVTGLYLAGLLAGRTGKNVLLLDGDVQTRHVDSADGATVPVLADAGTATLVRPAETARKPWRFSFLAKGSGGGALRLPPGGKIFMDGFAVFRFVATDVAKFIRGFLEASGEDAASIGAFVPHQANVYMTGQLADAAGIDRGKLWISADEVGNSASATIPVTISRGAAREDSRLLLAGFGGGLSAGAALVTLPGGAFLSCRDFPSGGRCDG